MCPWSISLPTQENDTTDQNNRPDYKGPKEDVKETLRDFDGVHLMKSIGISRPVFKFTVTEREYPFIATASAYAKRLRQCQF